MNKIDIVVESEAEKMKIMLIWNQLGLNGEENFHLNFNHPPHYGSVSKDEECRHRKP